MTDTIKLFNRLKLQSTINNYKDDHLHKNIAEINPKSNPLVSTCTREGNKIKITDTDTTNRNYPQKLLTNREIPAIVQGVIPPVNQTTADGVATSGWTFHAVRAVLHKDIVPSVTCSAAVALKYPLVVNWKDTSGKIPVDRNTVRMPPRTTTQVRTGTGSSVPTIIIGSQKIECPRRSIIPQEVMNNKPLDSYINRNPAIHRDPTPSWSKIISSKRFTNESDDVYAHGRMTFRSDTVLSESPNFMNFGLSSVNTTNELWSGFITTTRIGRPAYGSNLLPPGHNIIEATLDRWSGT